MDIQALNAKLDLVLGQQQEILDRQAIQDVIMRYCRGVDRAEPELIVSCFHDDAIDNHFGVVLPFREAVGGLKAAAAGQPVQPARTSSTHHICNLLIELDGDVAHSEAYLIIFAAFHHEGQDINWLVSGRFVDRFERREGAWRIASRTVVYDLDRFSKGEAPPDGLAVAHYLDRAVRGMKGATDLSYQEFRRLGA